MAKGHRVIGGPRWSVRVFLVARDQFAFVLLDRLGAVAIALCRSDGSNRRERNETFLLLRFLEHDFAVEASHLLIVRGFLCHFHVASAFLLFARVLGNTQLIEIVLLFHRLDLLFKYEAIELSGADLDFLAAGEDLVASVLLVP